MTAHFLPPVAARPKPQRRSITFPDVSGSALDGIPGKRGIPWFGILPEAVLDPMAFARRMYERFGPVHRFRACGSWNVQMIGPEANQFVLADEAGNFSSEGGWRPVFGRHFDGGLLLRDGADHHWHRKLIATAFKQKQLAAYLTLFGTNIKTAVAAASGKTLDLHEFAQQVGFASGYEAFLGYHPTRATREDLLSFRYLMQSSTSVVTMPLPGNAEWRASWAKRHVLRLISPMLQTRIAEHRSDLLAVLLRMRDAGLLDDEEVLAHLTFVIAASFDTLSSGTTSLLYYLAADKALQERVREEVCDVIPRGEKLDLAGVQRCELAERCFREALRLNAAAPVLWRRSLRPFSFGGYDFPSGTITGVNPMLTHLIPEIWSDPWRFDPDRFSDENCRSRHRFAYVPFGGGAHGCLGANYASIQIRALLRILLEGHELRLQENAAPRWYHWPNCRPRAPLRVEFVRRGYPSTSANRISLLKSARTTSWPRVATQ